MLDERKAAILRAVVQQFIETAQPVGSSRLAAASGVAVSSATIRNELNSLEDQGYLHQPHTSAGRVPTDKGYRFFVDDIAGPAPLDRVRQEHVSEFFGRTHGQIERMLQDTSGLLAHLTDATAIVVGPVPDAARVRSLQLVGLAPDLALVVVVLSNGSVVKASLDLPERPSDDDLAEAGRFLDSALRGQALGQLSGPSLAAAPSRAIADIASRAVESIATDADHEASVFVEGTSRVAAAFDAVETVRQVLGILEKQLVVVSLLRDVIDRGLSVAIGTETGVALLSECSVVVAPYEVEGEAVGTIGVLGPTRMNYPQAMAAVAVVSQTLGRALSDS